MSWMTLQLCNRGIGPLIAKQLGKLLVALSGVLADYKGDFSFEVGYNPLGTQNLRIWKFA